LTSWARLERWDVQKEWSHGWRAGDEHAPNEGDPGEEFGRRKVAFHDASKGGQPERQETAANDGDRPEKQRGVSPQRVDRQAERKSAMGQAPVYVYRFQWYSPVSGGRLRAMHCMDIPFAFDNVDNSQAIVGNGPGRQALADRMSRAWVAFARSGDPNHGGLPRWEPFSADRRATMMLNNECRLVRDPYGDERLALAAIIAAR
jgi:hypothetical protein